MNALVKKLMHVAIAVPDLDEALEFYRDVLGFTSVFQTRTDEADGRLLGFDQDEIGLYAHHILAAGAGDDATEINLVEFTDPRTRTGDATRSQMNDVGITRLALLVESVADAFEAIRTYPGVQIVCPPKEIVIREPEITFTTVWFSFRDPNGIFMTMTEPPRA